MVKEEFTSGKSLWTSGKFLRDQLTNSSCRERLIMQASIIHCGKTAIRLYFSLLPREGIAGA